jgi:hypothetical protein
MEKFWKIRNIMNIPIKITVKIQSNMSPGVILQPNQFCIGKQQMTAPLDKQVRTKKVTIEDFNNHYGLELATAYDESILDKAENTAEKYIK